MEKLVATVVVEPMAEAVFDPLPISIESIRFFFFIKSTRTHEDSLDSLDRKN